jgi:hypothetical protein
MAWTPGGHDSLVPPGFRPKAPIPNSPDYVERHPTRYRWRRHVKPLIRKLYREMGGPDEIHINTYLDHPEGYHRTLTSFDVWGPRGRGFAIGREKGERVRKLVFRLNNDPGLPTIEWAIWRRKIRRLPQNYDPRPFGDEPFEFHNDHLHFTFLR